MSRRTSVSLAGLILGAGCFIAAGLLLAASAVAQPAAAPPATQGAGATPGAIRGPGAPMRLNAQSMIDMIRSHMDELKLSDEQKAKIDALFDKAIADAKALEADATLQVQEKFPKIMQRIAHSRTRRRRMSWMKSRRNCSTKPSPSARGGRRRAAAGREWPSNFRIRWASST